MAFRHGFAAHFAESNRTDQVRRVHTVIYVADGCHRSTDRPHLAVDFDEIHPGGLINGTLTPVLWPRRRDLPTPPPPPVAISSRSRLPP